MLVLILPLGIFVPKSQLSFASDISEAFLFLNYEEKHMSTETLIEAGNIKPRIQFTADGVQREFQFFFKIYEPENVKVYIEDVEQDSGYSLSTKEDVQGGIITFDTAPESGKLVTIYRELELKRTTNFKEGGPFRSSNVNSEFDYQLSCLEQLEDSIGRTVTFPQYAPTNLNINLPMPDAGKSIIWSEDEGRLVNSKYQFDNIVNLSSQYCDQTQQYLNQTQEINSQINEKYSIVQQLANSVTELQEQAEANAATAQEAAKEAAANAVNSLYNQSETAEAFTITLKDGVSIYKTPLISEATEIHFDFSQLSNAANMVTFELYLCFSSFATITFPDISVIWLNGKEPNLEQYDTLTKILTFRNIVPSDFSKWLVSMEGGYNDNQM